MLDSPTRSELFGMIGGSRPVLVIDLFAGLGGTSHGALAAGAEVIAIEMWDEAIDCHRANHPHVTVINWKLGSARDWVRLEELIRPYRAIYHIHIHGSPPCQAISNASKQDASEGMPLVIWFLDTVERLKARGMCDSWSMENVVPVRKRLPEGTPSVVLNSANFGVAQTRSRCWAGEGWIAEPTHSREDWVGVIDALPHLKEELIGYHKPPSMENHWRDRSPEEPFPTVTGISVSQHRLVLPIQRKIGILKANGRILQPLWREIEDPINTITGARSTIGTQTESNERIELGTAWAKPKPGIVVNTAGCGDSMSKGGLTRDSPIESPVKTIHNNTPTIRAITDRPTKIRALTMGETLVLQGFPEDYDLSPAKTMKSRWTMVGNAVPPPVAEAVIRGIIQ